MIRWILETKWKPEIALAAIVFLVLGSLDLFTGSWQRMILTAVYSLAFVFLRNNSYLTGLLLVVGSAIHLINPLPPTYSDLLILLAVLGIAIFTQSPWRQINAIVAGLAALWAIRATAKREARAEAALRAANERNERHEIRNEVENVVMRDLDAKQRLRDEWQHRQ